MADVPALVDLAVWKYIKVRKVGTKGPGMDKFVSKRVKITP